MYRTRYSRTRDSDLWPAHQAVGAWAWMLHRISGVVIALYGVTHVVVISFTLGGGQAFDRIMELFQNPVFLSLELLLLGAVLYHMLNGVRIILFDLGVGIRRQKPLFWGLMGLGAVVLALAIAVTMPFIQGRPLT